MLRIARLRLPRLSPSAALLDRPLALYRALTDRERECVGLHRLFLLWQPELGWGGLGGVVNSGEVNAHVSGVAERPVASMCGARYLPGHNDLPLNWPGWRCGHEPRHASCWVCS